MLDLDVDRKIFWGRICGLYLPEIPMVFFHDDPQRDPSYKPTPSFGL